MTRFKKQTDFGSTGNCFSACLASVFDIPLEDVPNFYIIAGNDPAIWWGAVRDWLRLRGFGVMSIQANLIDQFEGLFIVGGESERGIEHAVLYQNGKVIFDPHPSNVGVKEVTSVDLLYPLDPSRLKFAGE